MPRVEWLLTRRPVARNEMAIHPAGRLWLWTLYSRTLLDRGLQCSGDTHMLKHTGIFTKNPWGLNIHGFHFSLKKPHTKHTHTHTHPPTHTKTSLQDGPNLRRNIFFSGPNSQKLEKLVNPGGGGRGTLIIFWWSVWPEVWNPYPYLRIFSLKKQNKTKQNKQNKKQNKTNKKRNRQFSRNFRKLRPIVMFFLPQKRLTLQFFAILVTGPPSKDFFDQNETHV